MKTILKELESPKFIETRRLASIYRSTAITRKDKRLKAIGDSMGLCGKYPIFEYRANKAGGYDYRNNYYHCGFRQCPACAERRNRDKREKIEQMLLEKGTKNFIFLTLTMPQRYAVDGCREHFDFLSKAVADLSRTKLFKAGVVGTFRALEGNSKVESRGGGFSQQSLIILATKLKLNIHWLLTGKEK